MNNSQVHAHSYIEEVSMTPEANLDELHTTLPLRELIGLFANEIRDFVEYDSFCYSNAARDIQVDRGSASIHSCHYNIKDKGLELGEVTLTRQSPFREEEMIIIERALGALSSHLINAVESQSELQARGN
ncbi:MAG: hypothetical protein MRY76_03605 [Pseudomonadales bacterium]|jgi:hypothetical protein|nr:hypothetical protein [Pseudomonadales bacterium]